MFRLFALLCLAAPVFSLFGSKYEKGFKVRYDVNPLSGLLGTAFMDLPQSKDSAAKMGWKQTPKPDLHTEFASLELWCPQCNNVCVLFDDTGYVAGLLIAFNMNQYSDALYNWTIQGFKNWITKDKSGNSAEYKYTAIYFSSPEYLKTSAEARIASRNPETLLQDKYIYVSGINGKLHPISTDVTQIDNTALSNFTLQACMPSMGDHYYYQMTKELECNDELFPFFPLTFAGRLVGMGFVSFGKYETEKGCTNYFEKPSSTAVKIIVPRGPDCLYELANSPGVITMHTYFIKKPSDMFCLPKLW
ncbi:hypothetical protein PYW08_007479 [Mythimna loreyi]|uniref:Uncharacterized protein n=1 Tax=Mythimna loreyi TaxID=667449 RepID=A0ACC2QFV6_9NEOP|nr:hypothetical protein PYW08_007479 [Mythimna loreyi]